jgi:hypothetical protein
VAEKLTSAERSARSKEAWAKRRAREAQEAAVSRQDDPGFDPAGAVAGEKLRVEPSGKGEVRVVHFIEDGFTALEKVWYRGQDFSITVGSPEWNLTVDKVGNTWLDMTEDEQIQRYGRVMFRIGPWKGKGVALMTEEEYLAALSDSDQEAIKKFEKQRQRLAAPPGVGASR